MYTTLKRLEKKEYIISYWQDGINTKRKYYKITNEGLNYLEEHIKNWNNTKKIISKYLED